MKRALGALAALAMAGACSSQGPNPVFVVVKEAVFSDEDSAATGQRQPLTRERIEQSGLALIAAQLEKDDKPSYLTAFAVNNGYVTFANSARQSINLFGGLVTATRGIGEDLLAVDHSGNDPVASALPPEAWPAGVARLYRFGGQGPSGTELRVSCTYKRLGDRDLEIVERVFEITDFEELCRGDVTFTNRYAVDRETGVIWQSRQWIGKDLGQVAIDVLEPYGP